MTRRILPRDEYDRLAGTLLGPLAEALPEDTEVIVIEDNGVIVGSAAVFSRQHVECPSVADGYRNRPDVFWSLLDGIRQTAARRGANRVIAGSLADADGEDRIGAFLLNMHAEPMPGRLWAWPIVKES